MIPVFWQVPCASGHLKVKERTVENLIAAIEEAMKEITPEDCQGWFRKAGYR